MMLRKQSPDTLTWFKSTVEQYIRNNKTYCNEHVLDADVNPLDNQDKLASIVVDITVGLNASAKCLRAFQLPTNFVWMKEFEQVMSIVHAPSYNVQHQPLLPVLHFTFYGCNIHKELIPIYTEGTSIGQWAIPLTAHRWNYYRKRSWVFVQQDNVLDYLSMQSGRIVRITDQFRMIDCEIKNYSYTELVNNMRKSWMSGIYFEHLVQDCFLHSKGKMQKDGYINMHKYALPLLGQLTIDI